MRAVFFCNEQFGLGHLRRSLALAGALVELAPEARPLVVTGSPARAAVPVPAGVATLGLPASPTDRHTRWSVGHRGGENGSDLASAEVRAQRAEQSLAAVSNPPSQVAVVDYLPTGRGGELLPALSRLRGAGGGDCRTVLGLREVDDADGTMLDEWHPERVESVRRLYDLALVYGPERPSDIRVQRLRDAGVEVRHVGRVASTADRERPADLPRDYLLATAGGGFDGLPVLTAVLDAIRRRPLGMPVAMVAGPMMPEPDLDRLRTLARDLDVRIERARDDMPAAMSHARAVVAMAGYNTVAELLESGTPAVLIPRAEPRQEQLVRARLVADGVRVRVVEPSALGPASLRSEIDAALRQEPRAPAEPGRGAREAAAAILELAAVSRSGTVPRRSATRRPG